MSEKQPKLKFEEDKERTATRSPPKKSKVEQSKPKKQKLKLDADKAAEKAQHLRFGKAEITPDEASRMTKQQKRAMYAAAAARSAAHREIDQYEDDNVGTQALNEGVKSEEAVSDFSENRYTRKLKKKAKLQAKKNTPTAKSSAFGSDKAQSAEATSSEGNSNWFSRWWQKQDIQKSYRAATRSGGTAAQTAGGKAASNGTNAAKSGMEQIIDKGRSVVSTAVNGIANFAKSNAHVLLIVGVFLLLLLLVMSAFSSCSIPIHRPILLNRTDLEIVMIYNAELRGLCNYYAIASNFNKLVYFGYLMEYSCLKTLANKHRSRISKVRYEYRDGTGAWGVPYETKKGKRRMMFAKYSDCKGKDLTEKVPDLAYRYSHNTTSFEERLKAKVCEVCGCTDSDSYEIHHVNKVKNLKGKADWEKVMLAKRRKTIVVCHKCHMRIHHGTKTE